MKNKPDLKKDIKKIKDKCGFKVIEGSSEDNIYLVKPLKKKYIVIEVEIVGTDNICISYQYIKKEDEDIIIYGAENDFEADADYEYAVETFVQLLLSEKRYELESSERYIGCLKKIMQNLTKNKSLSLEEFIRKGDYLTLFKGYVRVKDLFNLYPLLEAYFDVQVNKNEKDESDEFVIPVSHQKDMTTIVLQVSCLGELVAKLYSKADYSEVLSSMTQLKETINSIYNILEFCNIAVDNENLDYYNINCNI